MKEIWKLIKGWEGFYEISSLGRVRSVERIVKSTNGHSYHFKSRILKPAHDKYIRVTLCKSTIETRTSIHQLLAIAFIPNPGNKPHINHKDGNKYNNSLDNLEWCTPSENQRHAFKTGLNYIRRGEDSWAAKLTLDQVKEIRKLAASKTIQQNEIAAKFNISKSQVSAIKLNQRWKID